MGTVLERMQGDVKEAMKARNSERVTSLRMFVNALQLEEKAQQEPLDEAGEIQVLSREKKKRVEAMEAYESAGHEDRAAVERAQAELLNEYLPQQLSDDEVEAIIDDAIAETGASSMKDMGSVMKIVSAKTAGRADGKAASALVRSKLA